MLKDESKYFQSPAANALVLLDTCANNLQEAQALCELNAFTANNSRDGQYWAEVWKSLESKGWN